MWTAQVETLNQQTTKVRLQNDSRELSFREVIELWRVNAEFRTYITSVISESSFEAFFWETPPVTEQTQLQPFEFVLVEGTSLSRLRADPAPFMSKFSSRASQQVLTFPNLGGDAVLIVPAPLGDRDYYTHFAQFLRNAPRSQVDAFWQSTGEAMQERISKAPVWLSTAGMGVSWLHLRLDSRPKYYRYSPYQICDQ